MFALSALLGAVLIMPYVLGEYVFIESTLSWTDANTYCEDTYGTSLATVRNDYDADQLLEMKQDIGSVHVWIGLNDKNTEGDWEWTSGFPCDGACESLDYWNTDEPNDSGGEDCAVIRPAATSIYDMFNDIPCDYTSVTYFACDADVLGNRLDAVETDMVALESAVSAVESDVDVVESDVDAVESDVSTIQSDVDAMEERVQHLEWGQYVFVESQQTWEEANDYCASTYGTSLATIKNQGDADAFFAIKEYYQDVALGESAYFWTGLHDQDEDGQYVWASGFPCDGDCVTDYWYTGYPDDNGYCIFVMQGSTSGTELLRNYPCSTDNQFWTVCDADVLGNRVQAVESQSDAMEAQVQAVEAQSDAMEAEVSSLQNSMSSVESDVSGVESRLQSLENIMSGINDAIDSESGMTAAPLGMGDYALYFLALANLAVLVCLMVYCVYGRIATASNYGKVAMYETETDRV